MIFVDINTNKLHIEGKKACERVGVNPEDLIEKVMDEFQYNARNEVKPVTDEIIKMRYNHYENRRRKKLKLVFDEMSRHRRAYPGLKTQNTMALGYQ